MRVGFGNDCIWGEEPIAGKGIGDGAQRNERQTTRYLNFEKIKDLERKTVNSATKTRKSMSGIKIH